MFSVYVLYNNTHWQIYNTYWGYNFTLRKKQKCTFYILKGDSSKYLIQHNAVAGNMYSSR